MATHGDRVKETTTTTGTGNLTLGGASTGFLTFSGEIGEGILVNYLIEPDGGGWEIATGALSGSVLSRTTLKSSNSDAPLDLQAGTHTVSNVLTAATVDAKVEDFSDLDVPENAFIVLATEDQAVADANPTVGGVEAVWLIVEDDTVSAPTSAPGNFTATAVSDTEVELSYDAVTDATSYDYRVNGGTAVDVGDVLNPTVSGLTADTSYDFEVRAVNSSGNGPWSSAVNETTQATAQAPAAPTGLVATGGDGEVSLTWTASSGADGHRVYRNTSNDFSTATQVGSDLGAAANSYTDSTVSNDTEYWYWVTAFNTVGESTESTSDNATPTVPTGFQTDFSEYTTGSLPSDMTSFGDNTPTVETVSGATGGVALQYDIASGQTRRAAVFSESLSDMEALAKARSDTSDGSNPLRLIARAGADPTQDCYFAEVTTAGLSGSTVLVRKYTGGSITTIDEFQTSYNIPESDYVRIRFRLQGTTLKAKLWPESVSEPTTGGPDDDGFQSKATDTDHSSGNYGVGCFTPGLHDWDWISVVSGTGTAPEIT